MIFKHGSFVLNVAPAGVQSEQQQESILAQEARKQVMDYYGTAMFSGMYAAGGDLSAAQQMSDRQIIAEAKRLGLI